MSGKSKENVLDSYYCFLIIFSYFVYVYWSVSAQTACALQFLHDRNISHLDLKPQNILLSGSVLKLAGNLTDPQTLTLACKHTLIYMWLRSFYDYDPDTRRTLITVTLLWCHIWRTRKWGYKLHRLHLLIHFILRILKLYWDIWLQTTPACALFT